MSTLMTASNQWSSRPADQRFNSLAALHASAAQDRVLARGANVRTSDLRAVNQDGRVLLNGSTGAKANLTHWAFGQLARLIEAPADYLRRLLPDTAVLNINEGLARVVEPGHESRLWLRLSDGVEERSTVRAITSTKYTRIHDEDITKRLLRLEERGPWQPAPAAFDGSRGLYRGDRSMFAFMVDSGRRIFETLPGGGLSRGFFCWNSEVGAESFGIMTFLYEFVCGNHRVWGASNVKELRIRHVGNADERAWQALSVELKEYAEASAEEDEQKIRAARSYVIGADKDAVLDAVFGLDRTLTRGVLEASWQVAEERVDRYGDPKTAWAFSGAITEHSQTLANADTRDALDRAAGKVLEMAW